MITIRTMTPADDAPLAAVIRTVLMEVGAPKVGTAYADPILDTLYSVYDQAKSCYFVVLEDGVLIGGAGIAPLEGDQNAVCELQKMYLLEQARGKGLGAQLMARCLDFARTQGFEQCYLETLPYMKAAQKLYKKAGFEYLEEPLGSTGHYSCDVWMLKGL
ncbi:MAG: GNAT family N-acetyltransferase [Aureispira sp.]